MSFAVKGEPCVHSVSIEQNQDLSAAACPAFHAIISGSWYAVGQRRDIYVLHGGLTAQCTTLHMLLSVVPIAERKHLRSAHF